MRAQRKDHLEQYRLIRQCEAEILKAFDRGCTKAEILQMFGITVGYWNRYKTPAIASRSMVNQNPLYRPSTKRIRA